MDKTAISKSETETQKLAAKLLQRYRSVLSQAPLIFALEGELGSGKTTFVKGLAKALGIKKIIRSPSYTLVHEYNFDGHKFLHVDLWRVESEEEFLKLGVEPEIRAGNIIAIEWAEKIENFLKQTQAKVVYLKFFHRGEDKREIKIFNDQFSIYNEFPIHQFSNNKV